MRADHTWVNSSLCDVCILRKWAKAQGIPISRFQGSDRKQNPCLYVNRWTHVRTKCTVSLGTCFGYPWCYNRGLSALGAFDGWGQNGLLMRARWHDFLAWGLYPVWSCWIWCSVNPPVSEVHKLPGKFDMVSRLTYKPLSENGCSPLSLPS